MIESRWITIRKLQTLTAQVRALFRFTPLQYMLDAVEENPSLAEVFADDPDHPQTSAILIQHLLFIGGAFSEDGFAALLRLIQAAKRDTLYLLSEGDAWKSASEHHFKGECHLHQRSLYAIRPDPTPLFLPPEIQELSAGSNFANMALIHDEVLGTGTYDDMDDFFARGVCFAPIIDNAVYGFCTSEYPSKKAIAIGIEVHEPLRRRGYAKAMVKAFLARAAQKQYTVYWECNKSNVASSNTARSCGFEKTADYPILILHRPGGFD